MSLALVGQVSVQLQSLLVHVVDELCSTFVVAAKCKCTDKIKVVDMLDNVVRLILQRN